MASSTERTLTARLLRNDYLEYWFVAPAVLSLLALVIGPLL